MIKTDVLGVPFDNSDIVSITDHALKLIAEHRSAYAVTPNTEMVLEAQKNKVLMRALRKADIVIPDGVGVVYASRILGRPLKDKVAGIDFATALMARLSEIGGSVFLLGAAPGIAEKAASKLSERLPGLKIAGTHNGYFPEEENDSVIEIINSSKPDFLMVCLGFPEQEIWMMDNVGKVKAGMMAGLGGTLDVISGEKERAPEVWIKYGFEWLYRLIREPSRIGRMIKLPLILIKAAIKRIGG